jgi:hypothetical protein
MTDYQKAKGLLRGFWLGFEKVIQIKYKYRTKLCSVYLSHVLLLLGLHARMNWRILIYAVRAIAVAFQACFDAFQTNLEMNAHFIEDCSFCSDFGTFVD